VRAHEFVFVADVGVAAPIQVKHFGVGVQSGSVGATQSGVLHQAFKCVGQENGVLAIKQVQTRANSFDHLVQIIVTKIAKLFLLLVLVHICDFSN